MITVKLTNKENDQCYFALFELIGADANEVIEANNDPEFNAMKYHMVDLDDRDVSIIKKAFTAKLKRMQSSLKAKKLSDNTSYGFDSDDFVDYRYLYCRYIWERRYYAEFLRAVRKAEPQCAIF